MTNPDKPAIHLLFATIEPCPTFRPDVAALFGKFLPRFGVASDLVAERAPGVAGEVRWGGGTASSRSGAGGRPRGRHRSLLHPARIHFRAGRAKSRTIEDRD